MDQYRTIRIERGGSGFGGPLTITPDEKRNKIVYIVGGGMKPDVVDRSEEDRLGCRRRNGRAGRTLRHSGRAILRRDLFAAGRGEHLGRRHIVRGLPWSRMASRSGERTRAAAPPCGACRASWSAKRVAECPRTDCSGGG